MRRTVAYGLPVFLLLSVALLVKGALPSVATGTWTSAGTMSVSRTGATAVLLPDGRILITGGLDPNGAPLASAEFFNTDGSFSPAPAMSVPRNGHAAIWLLTGEVLVTGGTTTGGGVTNSAEAFDPLKNSWRTLPAAMLEARAGHTISQLQDGSLLIAGGANSAGPLSALERFDITDDTFNAAGALTTARKAHAAAALLDGRVLIAGGTDASGATLASSEIYDPASGLASGGPSLSTPRANASATTLLDGRVLIAGGSYPEGAVNGASAELASAETFDPAAGTINAASTSLVTARAGHQAFLLPNNANVLIVGGTSAGQDLSSTELYTPWTGQFQTTVSMAAARSAATGAALSGPQAGSSGTDGLLLVAGGSNLASAELYGFATVTTDQPDYAPGQTVTMNGNGWQPGETVTLTLVESPNIDTHPPLSAVADAAGHISNSSFVTDLSDLNIRFYLTATGSSSQAQTTFTDGTPKITSVSVSPFSPNQTTSASVKDTTVITATNSGSGTITDFRIRIRAGSTGGTLVREFLCGSVAQNLTCVKTWDGKDSTTAFVTDGTYIALASNGTTETTSPTTNIGTIVVDNTNPTATLTSPADNAFVSGNNIPLAVSPVDAGGDDSNIEKVEFYVDGTAPGNLVGTDSAPGGGWNFNLNTTTLGDGDHTWSAKAFDKAGNNAVSSSRTIKVDNTNPTVSVDPVANGSINNPITITGTSSDLPAIAGYGVVSVQVTISGAANNTGAATNTGTNFSTWSYTFTPTVGGNYSATAKGTDQAGNFSNATPRTFTVLADGAAPTTTLTPGTPVSGSYVTSATTFTLSCNDGTGSGCAATFYTQVGSADSCPANTSEASYTAYTSAFTLTGGEGAKKICFWSKDNAGNRETVQSQVYTVDNSGPTLTETLGAPNYTNGSDTYVKSSTSISVGASDPGSGLASCTLANGGPAAAYTAATNFNLPTPDGSHSYTVKCKDNLNNESTLTNTRIVDDTGPTSTVVIQTGPSVLVGTTTFVNSTTVFRGACSSDGAGAGCDPTPVLAYDPATGSFSGFGTTTDFSISSLLADGAKTVRVKTKDRLGNEGTAVTLTVTLDNTGPTSSVVIQTGPSYINGGTTYVSSTTLFRGACGSDGTGVGCDPAPALSLDKADGTGFGGFGATTDFSIPSSQADGAKTVGVKAKDLLGNIGAAATKNVTLDNTAPLFGACPAAGPFIVGGGTQSVGPISANDGTGAGLDNAASTLSGSVDTSTVGSKTVTFTAKDFLGNSRSTDCSYSVVYNFIGFLPPVDNWPINNQVKAGRTIPVKWQLKDAGGNYIYDLGTFKSLAVIPIACDAAPVDAIEETTATGGTVLRYDFTANQFIYNWSTFTSWRGCVELELTLQDNVPHYAKFQFK